MKERKIVKGIECTQKANEATKDRVIRTFKAEHEKMNEEESRSWWSKRRL